MALPIIFGDFSVQQIIRTLKTQSRRVKDGKRCPYGYRGHELWVREAWRQAYRATKDNNGIIYRADYGMRNDLDPTLVHQIGYWKSPLFLRHEHARLVLELTVDPWEQRLQDISDEEINKEGIYAIDPKAARQAFRIGWDALNGKRGYAYESNPAVWVLDFKVIAIKGFDSTKVRTAKILAAPAIA